MSGSATVSELLDPSTFVVAVRGPYEFGSRNGVPDEVANRLVGVMRSGGDNEPRGVLGGRSQSIGHDVPGLGRIFLKQYAHGGILRALTGQRFVGFGVCRSQQEFVMLEFVQSLGINVPKPLLYVKRGAFLYHTWLLMEELKGVRSLVEMSVEDPDSLQLVMKSIGEQLDILIKNRVLHIDLHPGNVLLDMNGVAYIVDFDKACIFEGTAWQLRDLYLRRWRRAVIKHGLPPLLTELMSLSLRSYNE